MSDVAASVHLLIWFWSQVKIQESPEDMPAGQTPHTTIVYAHNDLVDKVQPGDRINITGKDGSSEWFGHCWVCQTVLGKKKFLDTSYICHVL